MKKIISFCDKYSLLPCGGLVIAAVSGGKDSMCLLDVLDKLRSSYGYELMAVHFNHMIRGENADSDEKFVLTQCEKRGIKCICGRGDTLKFAKEHKMGTEEAARVLRYKFFEEEAARSGAACVATAHNADDNAETVLMNLSRGTALRGLGGIPPKRGIFVRPLLVCTRGDIEKYNEKNGIENVEDETNHQDIYTRNNIRLNVIPVLKKINSRFSENVLNMSDMARQDEDFIHSQAETFILENYIDGKIKIPVFNNLHPAVKTRVIKILCPKCEKKHIDAVMALTDDTAMPSAKCSVPGKTIYREYESIVFEKKCENESWQPFYIKEGEEHTIKELSLLVKCEKAAENETGNKTFSTFVFKSEGFCDKIAVRPRKTGDSIKLKGGTKSLKKLFIEKKIPADIRDKIPVVAFGDKAAAVYGVGMDIDFIPENEQQALKIEFWEI